MASKENQEALDFINNFIKKTHALQLDCSLFANHISTLQKAIDERELYKKAFEIAIETATSPIFPYDDEIDLEKYSLDQARKELENETTNKTN